MKRILLSAAAGLAMAGGAQAKDAVRIRAGEHGDYSRIVIPNPGGAPLVMAAGREITVTLDAAAADLEEIIARRAPRIASASQTSENGKLSIRFELNCDCAPRLSAAADGALILDVYGALAATAPELAPEPASETAPEAERARDRLRSAIAGASSSGVVRLRTGESAGAPLALVPTGLPTGTAAPLPTRDCTLENDLIRVTDTVAETASADALALSYLKRGFFAESLAVARAADATDRLAAIAAIAGALDGRAEPAAERLGGFAACGPAHRLLNAAARALEAPAEKTTLLGDEIEALESLPPELRFSVAEALAHGAHETGDASSAAFFAGIARDASPLRASVTLDIIAASVGPDDSVRERLAQAAREPGADQWRALEALGASGAPAPSPAPADLIADLSLAARLSPTDRSRLKAAQKAADLLAADGAFIDAVEIYARGHWQSAATGDVAREAAVALLRRSLEKGESVDIVSAAAGFLAHESFLAAGQEAPALRLMLAQSLAPLGDARIAAELLDDPRIDAKEKARLLDETNGAPPAAMPAEFAAFSNERLSATPRDPHGALRQARALEEEIALMRQAMAGEKAN